MVIKSKQHDKQHIMEGMNNVIYFNVPFYQNYQGIPALAVEYLKELGFKDYKLVYVKSKHFQMINVVFKDSIYKYTLGTFVNSGVRRGFKFIKEIDESAKLPNVTKIKTKEEAVALLDGDENYVALLEEELAELRIGLGGF